MDGFLRLITLQDSSTRTVLVGTVILGIAAAIVGTFAVLRRRALVGDAAAHAALPGTCVAFFVVGDRSFAGFMLGALLFALLAAAFVAFVKSATRVKEDAAIGLAIGGFFGFGIVLSRIIQRHPTGNKAGLDSFIFGKAASMIESDVRLIAIVAAIVVAVVLLLYKEFTLLCFDRDFAQSQGWPATALDLILMTLICGCTVIGLPAVGVVLVVSMLVLPPVAARFWSDRLSTVVILSAIFGALAAFLGTAISATAPVPGIAGFSNSGWPTGPIITIVSASIFILSMLIAPRRGVLAAGLRAFLLRRRIGLQNLLRSVYEHLEPGGDLGRPWAIGAAGEHSAAAPRAHRAGLITTNQDGRFQLTHAGQQAASELVRVHRLWELFLIEQAAIAPDHVDRDADQIEHLLPAAVLAELEERLQQTGRMPIGPSVVPTSPHPTMGPR